MKISIERLEKSKSRMSDLVLHQLFVLDYTNGFGVKTNGGWVYFCSGDRFIHSYVDSYVDSEVYKYPEFEYVTPIEGELEIKMKQLRGE